MVRVAAGDQELIFEVLDSAGRPIGRVVRPRGKPPLGKGMRTILLVRGRPLENRDR